uniref:Uncharacterized protein n=1 Tax=Cacopsylla melanoneura TaxID=428564 RepID=A0A8D8ULS6_9HEMI
MTMPFEFQHFVKSRAKPPKISMVILRTVGCFQEKIEKKREKPQRNFTAGAEKEKEWKICCYLEKCYRYFNNDNNSYSNSHTFLSYNLDIELHIIFHAKTFEAGF